MDNQPDEIILTIFNFLEEHNPNIPLVSKKWRKLYLLAIRIFPIPITNLDLISQPFSYLKLNIVKSFRTLEKFYYFLGLNQTLTRLELNTIQTGLFNFDPIHIYPKTKILYLRGFKYVQVLNFPNLTVLNLGNIRYSVDLLYMPELLELELRYLTLDRKTELIFPKLESLIVYNVKNFRDISKLINLKKLEIYFQVGYVNFPEKLDLKYLTIGYSAIFQEQLNHPNLTYLNLRGINSPIILSGFSKLTKLYLSEMNKIYFSSQFPELIKAEFSDIYPEIIFPALPKVKIVRIFNCRFKSLPIMPKVNKLRLNKLELESIQDYPELVYLILCQITGKNNPVSLINLPKLQMIVFLDKYQPGLLDIKKNIGQFYIYDQTYHINLIRKFDSGNHDLK